MKGKIELHHGDGGKHTSMLIKDIFYKHFDNNFLTEGLDSGVVDITGGKIAFTTDSFVVKPLFFPGGDIGKLSVYGSINDLAVVGAKPLYLSCGFIIEEGFKISTLDDIVKSMAIACNTSNVKIITGDTKVIEKGSGDGIFINTSAIGVIENNFTIKEFEDGDEIIVSGTIAEHGTTIATKRYNLDYRGDLSSDCGPVYNIVDKLSPFMDYIKFMRDPTRGGLATVLNEMSEKSGKDIEVIEENIPISKEVFGINEILGLDPLYLASEGRVVIVVKKNIGEKILREIRKIEGCERANIIGSFKKGKNQVYIKTLIGGKRLLPPLEASMVPRIC